MTDPNSTNRLIRLSAAAALAGGLFLLFAAALSLPRTIATAGIRDLPISQADPRDAVNEALALAQSDLVDLNITAAPGQAFAVNMALYGEDVTLNLRPHSVRGPGFRASAQLDDGSLVEFDAGPERTLRGEIIEIPGSKVSAFLLEEGLQAMIVLPGAADLLWIEPLAAHFPPGNFDANLHALYSSADVVCERSACGVASNLIHPHAMQDGAEQDGSGGVAGITCETVLIGIDVDFNFVQIWGNQQNALNRVNNIMNNTNLIYESQVGIIHLISEIIVRASAAANPYTCSSGGNMLGQFVNVWTSSPESQIPRNVAHLFTGCSGTGVGGIAQLGGANISGGFNFGVCRPNHYGLAVNLSTLACATHVTAHELGHNWSAQHCDGTSGCAGTIMPASFPPCSTTFSTFSQNQILNHKNSAHWGACTVPCVPPPPGNNTCLTSTVVSEGETFFTNVNATTEGPNEPNACNISGDSNVQSDVWFRHTTKCTGTLTVSLCDSSPGFDTKLAVYAGAGCPTDPGTAMACNKDSCGQLSSLTFSVTEGEVYRIRIGGHNGAQGEGTLAIFCEPDESPCPADLTKTGVVDVFDLLELLANWGPCDSEDCDADLTKTGTVDVFDLLELLAQWGPCEE